MPVLTLLVAGYMSMSDNLTWLTFIETPLFTRIVHDYLSDEEYAELQGFLAAHPEAGDIVPGSGGVRKLRWKTKSKGKRGGLRVIYYLRVQAEEIWLLTLYSKTRQNNIPAHILKAIKEEIDHD